MAEKPRLAAELVHEALKRGGVDADTYIVLPDPQLVPSLQDGSHAGSGALWRSPERERYLVYSKPYMENRLALVGRKGSSVRAASFSELAGKRVALIDGFAYGPDVDRATAPMGKGSGALQGLGAAPWSRPEPLGIADVQDQILTGKR